MTQLLPPKKEVALALLERSNVDVYLDPRAKGVVVPPQFRKEPRLILKIGLNMPVPIPDLRLDDESMSCTLSFSRSPFFCVVPWDSVFAMVGDDGRGMVWPDDVPQELAVRVVEEQQQQQQRKPEAVPPPSAAPQAPRRGKGKQAQASGETPEGPRAVADVPGDRPSRNGGKKSRKKKEEQRPVLVAVPSAQAPEKAERSERAEHVGRVVPRAETPPPSRQPPPSQRPPTSRPKRELPPYLRVVK